jgi:hypothetical protein
MRAPTSENPAPVNPVVISGRLLARRKLSERQRLALAAGLLTGAVRLDRLSWRQVLSVVPGVTVAKIYQMTKGRRVTSKGPWNGHNGHNGG